MKKTYLFLALAGCLGFASASCQAYDFSAPDVSQLQGLQSDQSMQMVGFEMDFQVSSGELTQAMDEVKTETGEGVEIDVHPFSQWTSADDPVALQVLKNLGIGVQWMGDNVPNVFSDFLYTLETPEAEAGYYSHSTVSCTGGSGQMYPSLEYCGSDNLLKNVDGSNVSTSSYHEYPLCKHMTSPSGHCLETNVYGRDGKIMYRDGTLALIVTVPLRITDRLTVVLGGVARGVTVVSGDRTDDLQKVNRVSPGILGQIHYRLWDGRFLGAVIDGVLSFEHDFGSEHDTIVTAGIRATWDHSDDY